MKKHLFLLPFLLTAFIAKAQFETHHISKSTLRPTDVKAFDFDGDGDMDILSASGDDNKIAWYENLGNGVFGPQQIISIETDYPQSVYAGDLDGDGDIDVVSASEFDHKIAWYENLGNGVFGPQQIITTEAFNAQSVYVADLDGDDDLDVLSASKSDGKIAWYENEGDGTFGAQLVITADANGASSVYAADLDGDGDLDVLAAVDDYTSGDADTDQIAWYENLGDGIFGDPQIITNQVIGARSVYAADLDGDGDMDVLSASGSNLHWYRNEGNGTFDQQFLISGTAYMVESVHAADLDGDGDMDVLAACGNFGNDNKITWYRNDGIGPFATQQIITSNIVLGQSVYTADLDGDGDLDVLSASLGDDKIAWYENEGDAVFGPQQQVSVEVYGAFAVHAADLDGDGDLDVLTASITDHKIAWYENEGNGSYGPQQIISTNSVQAISVYTADLDGDGDLDVLSASQGDEKIAWFENEGQGTFGPEQIISSDAYNVRPVYAADMDGDGDIDVVSAQGFVMDSRIAWFENLGEGDFGPEQIISLDMNGFNAIRLADLDGDGDIDVIGISNNIPNIFWFANSGSGTFGPQQIISVDNIDVHTIYVTDLDGDGDLDIITGSNTDGKTAWYENEGNGAFGAQQIISTHDNEVSSVYAADLDLDGDLDVISAYRFNINGGITWCENEGDGNFGSPQMIYNVNAESVFAADMDSDGDMDILSAHRYLYEGTIAWHQNYLFHKTQITGSIFLDVNQNGLHDSLDIGFNQLGIYSVPQSDYTFSYPDGNYFMNFSDTIGSYQIIPVSLPYWAITTDSLTYTVSIDSTFTAQDSLDFGFYPDSIFTIIQPSLTGGFPRCNDNINYWIDMHNQGTTLPSGIIHLQLADSITYISAETEPDSISGQNIYWHYDSLFYFSTSGLNLEVEMPPFTSMGDTLTSILHIAELDEESNIVYTNSDTLNQILVCAYDPNDKSVNPTGIGPEGYIGQNQELEYLIRFQNTGNDTAITVVIRDQLHENIDWGSLQPIASSHPMQIHVEQTGEAVFTFENIMLPDSNVDVLGSQGFVKFSVMPEEGLVPNTPLENTARIYFDFNPHIITNTVHNTIECYATPQPLITYTEPLLNTGVSGEFTYQWFFNGMEIPGATASTLEPIENGLYSVAVTDIYNCAKLSEEYFHNMVGIKESEHIKAVVYPNPFNESTTIVFSENPNREYDLIVTNVLGVQTKRINKIDNDRLTIQKSDMGTGVFLCYLVNTRTGQKLFIEKLIIL